MDLQIKSVHFDATEKLQDFVQKKTAKLEKLCDEIQKVEVQMKVIKPQSAINKEITMAVKVPGNTYYAENTKDTFEEAIDSCVDELKVQLEKYKEKLRKR